MARRLLVVDDEEPILFAMRSYFEALGDEVRCAREFEQAEILLASESFDVVIADLRLSGFGGTEGLEIISFVRDQVPSARVVLLTGFGSREIEQEAFRRGVDLFLTKPVELGELERAMSALLKGGAGASALALGAAPSGPSEKRR